MKRDPINMLKLQFLPFNYALQFFFLSDNLHLCFMLIKKIIGTDEMPWILIPGL